MSDQFSSLVGKEVKVNGGGPECRWGKLLDVKSDFCVLQTSGEGLVWYNSQHIKSMTVIEAGGDYDYLFKDCADADDFQGLCRNLKHEWVQINGGGPDKMEGVMGESNSSHFILVCGKEVVRVPFFHVKSICFAKRQNKNNNENQNNQSNNTGRQQNKNTGRNQNKNTGRNQNKNTGRQQNKNTGNRQKNAASTGKNRNQMNRRNNRNWISVTKRCN